MDRGVQELPGVLDDLAIRWSKARQAALRGCLDKGGSGAPELPEHDLLTRALAHDPAGVEKALFDNSLKLGRGFRQYYKTDIQLADLPRLFPQMNTPCCDGVFRGDESGQALYLVRGGCSLKEIGPRACDAWREAINGLVLGLTRGLGHSRHDSICHGGESCVDVIHTEGSRLRYGPVPEDIQNETSRAMRQVALFDGSARLELLGMNEGVLFYRLHQEPGRDFNLQGHFERSIRQRLPHLEMREASPRPVITG
ncbi:MAG: hypothetical protein GMKNLPBB_01888 [Myxococcota bacterium]|nr:hypothetical protein [Myxococcota bacterium]